MRSNFSQRTIKLPYGISVLLVSSFLLFFVPLFPEGIELTLNRLCFIALLFLSASLLEDIKRYYLYTSIVIIVLRTIGLLFDWQILNSVVDLSTVLFFSWISVKIISQIIHKEASFIVIIESISGYLLLAVSLTTIMGVIVHFDPTSFTFPPVLVDGKGDSQMSLNSYFIIITYTTVGYGDILPVSTAARSLAKFTALSGQIYMAVVVAILIGKYLQAKS